MNHSVEKTIVFAIYFVLVAAVASSQHSVITAEEVQAMLQSGSKVVVVDARMPEEYREGHIPGAVNIPAERVSAERKLLPKDKAVPLIFYCRGVG